MLKVKRALLAIIWLLGIFLLPCGTSAQTSIFDKFEEVRKQDGAEMLGAADRETYGMSEVECDVFILMLEDELSRKLAELNKPFGEFDAQQVMRAAFGERFDAAKLDDVSDYNVKSLIRNVLDSGYTIKYRADNFFVRIDYEYLIKAYQDRLSKEVLKYFELCLLAEEYTTSLDVSLAEVCQRKVDFILQAENYLGKYPDSYRRAMVVTLYRNSLSDYFFRLPNYFGVIKEGRISDAVLSSYKKTAHNYPETRLGWFADEVSQIWEGQERIYNSKVRSLLADIDKQIDLVSTERMKGAYLNSKGRGLFKAQGEKSYILMSGQIGKIQRAQQQFSKGSAYVLLEVKGVMEKTIPADMASNVYPQTFIIENVLGAQEWTLDDEVFQADFLAFGNGNATWSLRILTNDEVIFELEGEDEVQIFPYKAAVSENKNGKESHTYTLENSSSGENSKLSIIIAKQKMRNRLQGVDYDYKATVTLNGEKYEGYAFKQGMYPGKS